MLGGAFGKDRSDHEGITARAVRDVFSGIETLDPSTTVSVEMSYLEIYNEDVRDLLCCESKQQDLFLRDTKDGVMVQNLTWRNVESPLIVSELMTLAAQRRATGSTAMNSESSRSHAICTIIVHMKPESESEEIQAKLTLVDLAGSERIKRTGAEGARMKEGININKGLFVLGQVVSALSELNQSANSTVVGHSHIKYRDSKLTRLLQDSLGGNSKTVMVACVSPADTNLEESLNTLRYASRARNIKNAAIRNVIESSLSASEATALREENQKLKLQILQLQSQYSVMPPPSRAYASSTSDIFPFIPMLPIQSLNDVKDDITDTDAMYNFGLEVETSKDSDDSFDSRQSVCEAKENIKNELYAMSGTIEEKEQLVKKIVMDRDHMESIRLQVQSKIGTLQHEVDSLSRERDELLSKSKADKSRSTSSAKVSERILLLENQIKNLKEKLADHSKVLRQREEAEKKCTQLVAEITDDKKKKASLQRKLKEISDERRVEKKAAAMNAAKMLRDSQKLKCELAKVKEAAAKQEVVFKRKTAEVMLKRSRKASSYVSNDVETSKERKEELLSWIDKEISSSCYLSNLRAQINHQTKRYDDLTCRKAVLCDPSFPDSSSRSNSLDAELKVVSELIEQLENDVGEVLSLCSSKPSDSSIPFLDETVWNTLSFSDLRFVAVTFFDRYLALDRSNRQCHHAEEINADFDTVTQDSVEALEDTMGLKATVDNLLKSFVVSKVNDSHRMDDTEIESGEASSNLALVTVNQNDPIVDVDSSLIQDLHKGRKRKASSRSHEKIELPFDLIVDEGDCDDKDDSDWSPTGTPPPVPLRKSRSKKNSSSDLTRCVLIFFILLIDSTVK